MLWITKRTVLMFLLNLNHDIMDQSKLVVKLNGLVYQKFIKTTEWDLNRQAKYCIKLYERFNQSKK